MSDGCDVDDFYDVPIEQCPHSAAKKIDSTIQTHSNPITGTVTKFVRFKTRPINLGGYKDGRTAGGSKVGGGGEGGKADADMDAATKKMIREQKSYNVGNATAAGWKSKRNDFSDIGDDFVKPPGSVKRGKQYFKK
jgi:hypothetical protein